MPGRYFNVPYDCFGGAEPPAAVIDNQVEFPASRVGGWGGDCTCPDGSVYQVGDNYDGCRSLACVGGTSGQCNRQNNGPWSRRRVTCGDQGLHQAAQYRRGAEIWSGYVKLWWTNRNNAHDGTQALGRRHGAGFGRLPIVTSGGAADALTFPTAP